MTSLTLLGSVTGVLWTSLAYRPPATTRAAGAAALNATHPSIASSRHRLTPGVGRRQQGCRVAISSLSHASIGLEAWGKWSTRREGRTEHRRRLLDHRFLRLHGIEPPQSPDEVLRLAVLAQRELPRARSEALEGHPRQASPRRAGRTALLVHEPSPREAACHPGMRRRALEGGAVHRARRFSAIGHTIPLVMGEDDQGALGSARKECSRVARTRGIELQASRPCRPDTARGAPRCADACAKRSREQESAQRAYRHSRCYRPR